MRRAIGDEQDVFRVVVVQYRQVKNPAYVQGGTEPYYLTTDETFEQFYGPYNTIGAARGILTTKTWDTRENRLRWNVSGGRIEKAKIEWETV